MALSDVAVRFWTKVRRGDGCWPWLACRDPQGYGRFSFGRVPLLAHRVAFELARGPIADGMCVCHRCDNPGCCNPGHMFLGTLSENVADMVAKGRQARTRGAKSGMAKLTEEQARECHRRRVEGERVKDIARSLGVSGTTVSNVLTGETWGHLGLGPTRRSVRRRDARAAEVKL